MAHDDDMAGAGGFAVGMILGAVAGASLALLFAPKSGANLRRDVGRSMGSLRESLGRCMHSAADTAEHVADDLHDTYEKAKGAVESTARDVADVASKAVRGTGRRRGSAPGPEEVDEPQTAR